MANEPNSSRRFDVRIPDPLMARMMNACDAKKIKRATLIRIAIVRWLKEEGF